MSHKTQFKKLKDQNKTDNVSTLHLTSQKTLDVSKKIISKKNLYNLFIKKNSSFLLYKLIESFYKLLETIANYH